MSGPKVNPHVRSPLLLDRENSILVVVDVQEKLIGLIRAHEKVTWNIGRLLQAARILEVPSFATEQYPKGLGNTIEPICGLVDNAGAIPEKTLFSCRECTSILEAARDQKRYQIVLTGIETHVCVTQTAMDFIAAGVDVFCVADAVGSRSKQDYRWALQRMQLAGATIVTTESVMFEWCESSNSPEFKQISQLVKETALEG